MIDHEILSHINLLVPFRKLHRQVTFHGCQVSKVVITNICGFGLIMVCAKLSHLTKELMI